MAFGKKKDDPLRQVSAKRDGIARAHSVIFGAMAVAAIVVAMCFVLLNFLWNLRGFNNRVIEARTVTLQQLDTNILNLEQLKLDYDALEQDEVNSQIVLDSLPSEYDFPALLTSIEKQITEDKLTLVNISGEDETKTVQNSAINPTPYRMPFEITVEGTYKNLESLMQNFEKTIRPLYVDSFELSGTDQKIRAEIRMSTYFQPSVQVDLEKRTIE